MKFKLLDAWKKDFSVWCIENFSEGRCFRYYIGLKIDLFLKFIFFLGKKEMYLLEDYIRVSFLYA